MYVRDAGSAFGASLSYVCARGGVGGGVRDLSDGRFVSRVRPAGKSSAAASASASRLPVAAASPSPVSSSTAADARAAPPPSSSSPPAAPVAPRSLSSTSVWPLTTPTLGGGTPPGRSSDSVCLAASTVTKRTPRCSRASCVSAFLSPSLSRGPATKTSTHHFLRRQFCSNCFPELGATTRGAARAFAHLASAAPDAAAAGGATCGFSRLAAISTVGPFGHADSLNRWSVDRPLGSFSWQLSTAVRTPALSSPSASRTTVADRLVLHSISHGSPE